MSSQRSKSFSELKPKFEVVSKVFIASYKPVPLEVSLDELRDATRAIRHTETSFDESRRANAERRMTITYECEFLSRVSHTKFKVTITYYPYAGEALIYGAKTREQLQQARMDFDLTVTRPLCRYMHQQSSGSFVRCMGMNAACHCAIGENAPVCMNLVARVVFKELFRNRMPHFDFAGIMAAYSEMCVALSDDLLQMRLPSDRLPEKIHRTRKHTRISKLVAQGQGVRSSSSSSRALVEQAQHDLEAKIDDQLSQVSLIIGVDGTIVCMGLRSEEHARAMIEEIFDTMLKTFFRYILQPTEDDQDQ